MRNINQLQDILFKFVRIQLYYIDVQLNEVFWEGVVLENFLRGEFYHFFRLFNVVGGKILCFCRPTTKEQIKEYLGGRLYKQYKQYMRCVCVSNNIAFALK
eukprot:TRINITY_DN5900_c0_g5_i1.p3 TRINITY_DN5900_c0_g5~~TRINITY_DN5900_c0_g5_i1.p3  ORF type:complete len:101 (+),score=5.25 TRINITY_DN5900_c0_g5_i1:240-542(+)